MQDSQIEYLKKSAQLARKYILDQIYAAGSGHPGGSLSCVELLTAIYLHHIKPGDNWIDEIDRDHVILSKGHAAPALYAVLAVAGIIPEEELRTLRKLGSRLQGHPDLSRCKEIEMSTGSLGQGLSVGIGQSLALEYQNSPHHSFVILGDGEMNSGQVWEAISYAGSNKLSKLIALIDLNGLQNDGLVKDILNITPYEPKLEAFGWAVKTINGNDIQEVVSALDWAKSEDLNKPKCIVANTKKGAGVSFIVDRVDWHSHALTEEQYNQAVQEVMS